MAKSNCFPRPADTPIMMFRTSESFTPSSDKTFETEIYWNVEAASLSAKQYLLSILLPMYLESTSLDDIPIFLDYYIYGNENMRKHLMLYRDKISHQVEGYITVVELENYYYLPNDFSKENSYTVFAGMGVIRKESRNKGLLMSMYQIYNHILTKKSFGRNTIFFETAINPIAYMKISRVYDIYPSYKNFASLKLKEFIISLTQVFQEDIQDPENPFCVYDGTSLKEIDKEYWFKNYQNLSNDLKFFIDQTKLREGYGVVYIKIGSLLPSNTLGLCPSAYTNLVLPGFDVKEHSFRDPKI